MATRASAGSRVAAVHFADWAKDAVIRWLTGLILGCVTALLLVGLSATMFSEIQEVGQDLGLRLGIHLQRLRSTVSGRPLGADSLDGLSFLFIDVDPEHGLGATPEKASSSQREMATGSQRACAALATASQGRYRVVVDTPARASAAKPAANTPTPIHCSASRPVNRYLLAELVKALQARGARMIVLDVVLAAEYGIVPDEENEALKQALRGLAGLRPVPILYADPVEAASPRQRTRNEFVRLDTLNTFGFEPTPWVRSAVALPSPGYPLRRYPKCLFQASGERKPVLSLPFLAATMLRKPGVAPEDACPDAPGAQDDATNAPRIVYTFPPFEGHQDDTLSPERAQWAVYQPVYNRCLAENFWNGKRSACGGSDIYRGKVVVVGASNPLRRDRHYTPLGDMAGAEVVINATQSFVSYPENRDKRWYEALCRKLAIVGVCSFVWLGYFMLACRIRARGLEGEASRWRRLGRCALVSLGFLVALAVVCIVAFAKSYDRSGPVPSLDIFIPVLAIGLDVYVEWISVRLERIKASLRKRLGLPEHAHQQLER